MRGRILKALVVAVITALVVVELSHRRRSTTGTRSAERPSGGPLRMVDPLPIAYVECVDGDCPDSHPVKVKLSSGIFHSPGTSHYMRTRADRCYSDSEAASEDGFRAPLR